MAGNSDDDQRELDKAWNAAMEEEWKMKTLENELTPIVKKIIVKNYPETFHLESEQHTTLDNIIWKHIDKLVRDVNNIANTMAKEE